MGLTIYKRLFEVRILHSYYLDNRRTAADNASAVYFGLSPQLREELLQREDEYSILKDLEIVPTRNTVERMRQMRIRLKLTPTGFFASLQARLRTDGKLEPFLPLAAGSVFTFLLKVKNSFWYNFTAHAMRPSLPAKYLFTNRPEAGLSKTAPSLSVAAPAFNPARTWEMGELASVGGGNLAAALKTDPAAGDFSAPFADFSYATTADRLALPKLFEYRFDSKAGSPTSAVFTLKTTGGVTVKTVTKNFPASQPPPASCSVDLRLQDTLPGDPIVPVADGRYVLEISVNGNPFGSPQPVYLLDDLPADDSVFAVVEMAHEAGLPLGFELLNADGSIRATKDPLTNRWKNQSVFDIRLAAKRSFWLYHVASNNGQTTGDVTQIGGAGQLITLTPRRATRAFQHVGYGVNQTQFLPNPSNLHLNYDPVAGRFLSEIFISLPTP